MAEQQQQPASQAGDRKSAPPVMGSNSGGADGSGGTGGTVRDVRGFLAAMRQRRARSSERSRENRQRYQDDVEFLVSDQQWPQDAYQARMDQKRPAETFNLLPKYFFQVSNELKQNKPSFSVKPEQGEAETEAAEVFEGMLRHISNRSLGEVARETAVDGMVAGGFGYYGLTSSYVHDGDGQDADELAELPEGKVLTAQQEERLARLFELEVRFRHIPNPLACHDDPDCKLPTRLDREYFFIEEPLDKETFRARYPEAHVELYAGEVGTSDATMQGWWSDKEVKTVEYWWVDTAYKAIKTLRGVKGNVPKERRLALRRVKWCIATAQEILEEGDWPGKYIPFVVCRGWTMNLNGKEHIEGKIHQSKGAQIAYNYLRTAQMERIGLHSLAKWLVAEGQQAGYEAFWSEANTSTEPCLIYKPKALGDTMVPPPREIEPPPPSGDIIQAGQNAREDVAEILGQRPPGVPQPANRTLGQDKLQQLEGDTNNYHFVRGLQIAIMAEGEILKDLIPKVYDTKRQVRILGEDGSARSVHLNPDVHPDVKPQAVVQRTGANGEQEPHYNLGQGEYGLTVTMGPAFATQMEKARDAMLELMRVGGPAAQTVLPTFFARMSQFKEHETIAELFQALLPPQLQQVLQQTGGDQKQKLAAVQGQVVQLGQLVQQMGQALQAAAQQIKDKRLDAMVKLAVAAEETAREKIKLYSHVTGEHEKGAVELYGKTLDHAHALHRAAVEGHLDRLTAGAAQAADAAGAEGAAAGARAEQAATPAAPAQSAPGGGTGSSGGAQP